MKSGMVKPDLGEVCPRNQVTSPGGGVSRSIEGAEGGDKNLEEVPSFSCSPVAIETVFWK
jgi:hypothetical protein